MVNMACCHTSHWGRDKMGAMISQTTFPCAFPWMDIFQFRWKFHWILLLRVQLTIFRHWFRWWLGAVQATSHYLNHWWLVYRRIFASFGLNVLNKNSNNPSAVSIRYRSRVITWDLYPVDVNARVCDLRDYPLAADMEWTHPVFQHPAVNLISCVNPKISGNPLATWDMVLQDPRTPFQYKDRLIYVWRFPC